MASRAHIQYQGDPKALKKHLRPAVKSALTEIVEEWHEKTLPVHFTEAGSRRYHYRRRTKKYEKTKAKKRFHSDPLVYTGDLKREAFRRLKVTGTAKRITGTMVAPWYATKHFRGKSSYAEEMTAVVGHEVHKMAIDTQSIIADQLSKKQNEVKETKR